MRRLLIGGPLVALAALLAYRQRAIARSERQLGLGVPARRPGPVPGDDGDQAEQPRPLR